MLVQVDANVCLAKKLAVVQKTHEEQLAHQMVAMVRATNELATVKGEYESQRAGRREGSVRFTREPRSATG